MKHVLIDGFDAETQEGQIAQAGYTVTQAGLLVHTVESQNDIETILSSLGFQDKVICTTPWTLGGTPKIIRAHINTILAQDSELIILTPPTVINRNHASIVRLFDEIESRGEKARAEGGKKGGRPKKLSDRQIRNIQEKWLNPKMSSKTIAKQYGISISTLRRIVGATQ